MKLAAQAAIPINPVLTPVATDVPGVELNMFELTALGLTLVSSLLDCPERGLDADGSKYGENLLGNRTIHA